MIPDLEPPENPLPRGSLDLGNGYVLLTATDNASREVDEFEGAAIRAYLVGAGHPPSALWQPAVTRWSRVRLPNGQVARSAWKETLKPIEKLRCARNVKVSNLKLVSGLIDSESRLRSNVMDEHALQKFTST